MPSTEVARLIARVEALTQRFDPPARPHAPMKADGPPLRAVAAHRRDFGDHLTRALSQPTPVTATPPAAGAAQTTGTDLVALATTQIGKPYRWGAGRDDAAAFDCSGFVAWVYQQAGRRLPAFTDSAFAATVPANPPRPGDLVFFRYDDPHQPGVQYPHVGIYAGDGMMIDAAADGGVQRRPLRPGPIFRRLPDAAAAPATLPDRAGLAALVASAAAQYGLDPRLVTALVQAESGFNPRAVSPAGAKGLMQLMDGTARTLGVGDPFDPQENVTGGVRYLRSLLDRYQGDLRLALAAYNAGPGAVDRAGGVPPYPETQHYVDRVLTAWGQRTTVPQQR